MRTKSIDDVSPEKSSSSEDGCCVTFQMLLIEISGIERIDLSLPPSEDLFILKVRIHPIPKRPFTLPSALHTDDGLSGPRDCDIL
jgi:hypothetical protein